MNSTEKAPVSTPSAKAIESPVTSKISITPAASAAVGTVAPNEAKAKIVAPAKTATTPRKRVSKVVVKPVVKAVEKIVKTVVVAPEKKAAKADKKVAVKVAAKETPKSAVKVAAKVAPRVTPKTAEKPKVEKLVKGKKPKLVRDSFTIPKAEFTVLDDLKIRSGKLGNSTKKSELIRAGIKALASMSDAAFLIALKAVPAIKTGRPAKE